MVRMNVRNSLVPIVSIFAFVMLLLVVALCTVHLSACCRHIPITRGSMGAHVFLRGLVCGRNGVLLDG